LVTIKIYDLLGREVAVLIAEKLAAGLHSVKWEAGTSSSDFDVYRLETGNEVSYKKLLLVR